MSDQTLSHQGTTVNPDESLTEEWRSIQGFEGRYEVSNYGQVRSLARSMNNRWGTSHPVRAKILAPDSATGYHRVSLRKNGRLFRAQIHRLIAKTFLGGHLSGRHVNHKDGNKTNNRIDNLEWTTPRENVLHAWRMGLCRPMQGEAHSSKLTNRDIFVILDAASRGIKHIAIGNVFNVSGANISTIVRGKGWAHLYRLQKESA